MIANENFCLRLNEFENNVKLAWQDLQMEEDYCDMTLACEDKQIKTHKLIISSFSPVLRNILKLNQNTHPFIYLRRVKYENLKNLLNFLYKGEVDVAEEDLNVRGLSKGNMEGCDSNTDPYTKTDDDTNSRNRIIRENENMKPFGGSQPSGSFIEDVHVKTDNNFMNNDNDILSVFSPSEDKRIEKQKSGEDVKLNIISTLAGHAEEHFSCGKCNKQFSSNRGLDLHTKSIHEGVEYSCDKCDYKATQRQTLNRHVKSIHEIQQLPCDQCDYKATRKYNLHSHQMKYHN